MIVVHPGKHCIHYSACILWWVTLYRNSGPFRLQYVIRTFTWPAHHKPSVAGHWTGKPDAPSSSPPVVYICSSTHDSLYYPFLLSPRLCIDFIFFPSKVTIMFMDEKPNHKLCILCRNILLLAVYIAHRRNDVILVPYITAIVSRNIKNVDINNRIWLPQLLPR